MGNNRSVRVILPADVWKVIDTQFKPLNGGGDFEILVDIIKKHLAENAYYQDLDSLNRGHGMKEIITIQGDMIMAIIKLLERKGLGTYEEWSQIMLERIMK
jgi:hypothetical protein